MTRGQRLIVLCADDFGLAPGVSEAIKFLIEGRRLSATSCMTVTSTWPRCAPDLKVCAGHIDVGLHLTLTSLTPLGPMPMLAPKGRLPSLMSLIRDAFAGRLDGNEIREELRRQLDAFVSAFGRLPDFIDGHQHVHVLPTVREQVLALYDSGLLSPAKTYLRVPAETPWRLLRRRTAMARSLFLTALAAPMRATARRGAIPVNEGFGGVRDFDPHEDYRRVFLRTLATIGAQPIVMCHPGHVDAQLIDVDPVTEAREQEFSYFAGEAFLADLDAAGCRLSRFRDVRDTSPDGERQPQH